jgi:ribonuclease R
MLNDQAILRHIERQPHQSAGYKQLVREMNLRGDDRRLLAERLEALVKSARLIETGRDRFTLAEHAAAHQNLIAGRLTMHRDGYGFVIPNVGQRGSDAPTLPPKAGGRTGHPVPTLSPKAGGRVGHPISGDIFIPPPAIGSAMHGDQVLVELTRKKDDGRAEGRILRVLTRGNPTVVGTFHRGPRQNYVTPIDEKVTQQIVIPRGMEWPGEAPTHSQTTRMSGAPEDDANPPRPGQKKARTGHPVFNFVQLEMNRRSLDSATLRSG